MTEFLTWGIFCIPVFVVVLQGVGICVVFRGKRYLGCRVKVRLSWEKPQSILPSPADPGGPHQPSPQPGLLPSAHSSEGILAEWILRPGQFQGNPGALGPDRGDRTSQVTLRTGQAAHTWPHQALGLPGTGTGGPRDGFLDDELPDKV